MSTEFRYFLDVIPPDMYARTKATTCRYIAVFEPEEYALGEVISVDDYHFLLLFANAPVTRINNVEYRLKKGDLLVVRPWEEVYGVPDKNREYGKYLHIAVKKEFFAEIASEAAKENTFEFKRVHGKYSNRLLDLIGEFQLEIMNYGESYPKMLYSLSTQIVFQLIRDLNAGDRENMEEIDPDNPYISKAILFMKENYQANISIKDICDSIYLSPYHFKRIFKEHTGCTPHRYLMDIKLEKAKELLAKNKDSIEIVARLCGFVNSGHFAVVFRRETGLTPTEYRKMCSQK